MKPATIPRPGRLLGAMLALLLVAFLAGCAGSSDTHTPGPAESSQPPTRPAEPVSCDRPATEQDPGLRDGLAIAPDFPPTDDPTLRAQQETIRRIIEAGNQVATKDFRYGGGHRPFAQGLDERGYDASGAVSWALHAGGLLDEPLSSGEMVESWGVPDSPDTDSLLTVWAHRGNVFIEIGRDNPLRLYTSAAYRDPCALPGSGPRWTAVDVPTRAYWPLQAPSLTTPN